MKTHADQTKDFAQSGRVWLRNAISETDLAAFDTASALQAKAGARLGQSEPLDAGLAADASFMAAMSAIDPCARPVRVVAFNKSQGTNWGVPWHQDRVIAVAERHDVTGYKNWSQKAGVWHCEPPHSVLSTMLFVRIHLDDSDARNGAMQIAVGSHTAGLVPAQDAAHVAHSFPIETCVAKRGDVLILNMLTLHGSQPSKIASDRRVLRVDLASQPLSPPLRWT